MRQDSTKLAEANQLFRIGMAWVERLIRAALIVAAASLATLPAARAEGSLCGAVAGARRTAIDAIVALPIDGQSKRAYRTRLSDDGTYAFADLPAGRYVVYAATPDPRRASRFADGAELRQVAEAARRRNDLNLIRRAASLAVPPQRVATVRLGSEAVHPVAAPSRLQVHKPAHWPITPHGWVMELVPRTRDNRDLWVPNRLRTPGLARRESVLGAIPGPCVVLAEQYREGRLYTVRFETVFVAKSGLMLRNDGSGEVAPLKIARTIRLRFAGNPKFRVRLAAATGSGDVYSRVEAIQSPLDAGREIVLRFPAAQVRAIEVHTSAGPLRVETAARATDPLGAVELRAPDVGTVDVRGVAAYLARLRKPRVVLRYAKRTASRMYFGDRTVLREDCKLRLFEGAWSVTEDRPGAPALAQVRVVGGQEVRLDLNALAQND